MCLVLCSSPPNPPHLLDLLKSENTMNLVCIYRYFTRLNKNNNKKKLNTKMNRGFLFLLFFFLFLIFFPNVTSVAEWHSSKCWSSLRSWLLGAVQVELEADAEAALLVCPRSPALVSEAAVAFADGEAAA